MNVGARVEGSDFFHFCDSLELDESYGKTVMKVTIRCTPFVQYKARTIVFGILASCDDCLKALSGKPGVKIENA